jgi:hypothetical protein
VSNNQNSLRRKYGGNFYSLIDKKERIKVLSLGKRLAYEIF